MNFGFRIVDDEVAKIIATMIENKKLHLSPKSLKHINGSSTYKLMYLYESKLID